MVLTRRLLLKGAAAAASLMAARQQRPKPKPTRGVYSDTYSDTY